MTLSDDNLLLAVYDALGKLVKTIYSVGIKKGTHTFTRDAKDDNGGLVSSGVYFVEGIFAGEKIITRVMLIE